MNGNFSTRRHLVTALLAVTLAGLGLAVAQPALAGAAYSAMVAQRGASAAQTDPLSVVEAFNATASSDVTAASALVADNAVFTIVPPPPGTSGVWRGKAQIQGFLEFRKRQNAKDELVGAPQVVGDTVTATDMVTANDFRALGLGAVEHTYEAVVQGGKITSLTTTMTPAEQARVAAAARAHQAAPAAGPPVGMPQTGSGAPSILLIGLLGAALLCVAAGVVARRAHWRV